MSLQSRFDKEQWDAICAIVTERMTAFTRPFVTPLVHESEGEAPRIGTGSYVELDGRLGLLTCEHVARWQPQSHRPTGQLNLSIVESEWRVDAHPKDVAATKFSQNILNLVDARALSMSAFAERHEPAPCELLFFRGVAGENAYVGFGGFDGIMSGYCSQEKRETGDGEIFEVFWEPENTQLTPRASREVGTQVKYDNAEGLSGSLVWNTRFSERDFDLDAWSPSDAVVTGLLRRWDTSTRTLLVWRVEHLRSWLMSSSGGLPPEA